MFVVSNHEHYGNRLVFVLPEVLAKYEARSGVAVNTIETALQAAFDASKHFFIKEKTPLSLYSPSN